MKYSRSFVNGLVVFALFASLFLMAPSGCKKRTAADDQQNVAVKGDDAEFLIVIGVDLSGSFLDRMARDGKGYAFTMRVADTYFRNSVGTNNRIVIAQLSATNRALLWDGTPVQLRHDFPNPTAFSDFLMKKANPNGSRIHDGISDAFDYVISDPGVQAGHTKTAVFVLSDFLDNLSDAKSEERLAKTLTSFGKTKGVVGFYFLDHDRVPTWRGHLRNAGIKQWVCESEIVAYPTLPSFD